MSRARVAWHYLRARRRRFADRAALLAWQQARLRVVLDAAPRRYPYYAGLTAAGLDEFPILDKDDVLGGFAGLNIRGLTLVDCLEAARLAERDRDFTTSLSGLSVGVSSGTSGRQTAFLTSQAERDRWAGEVLARAFPSGLTRGTRVTLVLRAGGPLYESVDGSAVSFRFVDLALPPDRLVDQVLASAPTVLVAPPSVLVLLAQARWVVPPARVFSVAEVLDPHDRTVIEAGLGVRVDQVYQATEGFLGMSCPDGSLHLTEDLVVVEQGDVGGGDGRFSPLVTDLFRRSQAVIRRRLGDVLVPGTCGCGDPRLVVAEILGREDDVLWLPRASEPARSAPFFPDFVRAAVLAVGADDFRVVQVARDRLLLATAPAAAFTAARDSLLDALERAGFAQPLVDPTLIEPRDPISKLRRVRRDDSVPAVP